MGRRRRSLQDPKSGTGHDDNTQERAQMRVQKCIEWGQVAVRDEREKAFVCNRRRLSEHLGASGNGSAGWWKADHVQGFKIGWELFENTQRLQNPALAASSFTQRFHAGSLFAGEVAVFSTDRRGSVFLRGSSQASNLINKKEKKSALFCTRNGLRGTKYEKQTTLSGGDGNCEERRWRRVFECLIASLQQDCL
ncbi:hypothetical protein BaRGS_00010443 [Batillaria attramentaria]|uniref:Uncharacterized protein n=1 Tax=Batillaria attramentaria TaxID=370345 RepID=A0ABD0LGC8_9CAEN